MPAATTPLHTHTSLPPSPFILLSLLLNTLRGDVTRPQVVCCRYLKGVLKNEVWRLTSLHWDTWCKQNIRYIFATWTPGWIICFWNMLLPDFVASRSDENIDNSPTPGCCQRALAYAVTTWHSRCLAFTAFSSSQDHIVYTHVLVAPRKVSLTFHMRWSERRSFQLW